MEPRKVPGIGIISRELNDYCAIFPRQKKTLVNREGTTLKKNKPLSYNIPIFNVLESGNNSWGGCLCDNFEDIITSGINNPAQKTRWFQCWVLVCISMPWYIVQKVINLHIYMYFL